MPRQDPTLREPQLRKLARQNLAKCAARRPPDGQADRMSTTFGGLPTRFELEPAQRPGPPGVAIVLPGRAYSPAHPLLEFGRQALLQWGWTVQQLWWDAPRTHQSVRETVAWVCEQARATIGAEQGATRILIMAKSLGTLAAPVAAEEGLPGIWFTPLCHEQTCLDGIRAAAAHDAPQLLVGGSADPEWDTALTSARRLEVVQMAGADHGLVVEGDTVRTVEAHLHVARAVDAFLARLAERGQGGNELSVRT